MTYTEEDLRMLLEAEVAGSTMRSVAKELEVSPALISAVLAGRKHIGPKLAESLGFEHRRETTVSFRRIEQ